MNVANEVREIVMEYIKSSDVILLSNMNASMFCDPPLLRNKYLKVVFNEMNLGLREDYTEIHTYRHGTGKSIINFIIYNIKGQVTSEIVFDEQFDSIHNWQWQQIYHIFIKGN